MNGTDSRPVVVGLVRLIGVVLVCTGIHFGLEKLLSLIVFGVGLILMFVVP